MILDGWGIATDKSVSAIDQANTPFIDSLYQKYPHSRLTTHGMQVGLPEGQMGNSEVGHMNLGAGRVVYQDLAKINLAIQEKTLNSHPVLVSAFKKAKEEGRRVHFLGLLSDGGVHAHINHVKALCSIAADHNLKEVFVHAFADGRDTDPKGGAGYVADLQKHMQQTTGQVATVTGRYYAMDRDKRWERIKLAYDAMVNGKGEATKDVVAAIQKGYNNEKTDEFIEPIVATNEAGQPIGNIQPNDVVVFFNYRNDRARELTEALYVQDFEEQGMKKLPLHYITFTTYDKNFDGIEVLYKKEQARHTLGEVLAAHGKKQIRIAETEKYPHVTYFFNNGREAEFEGESRILVQSPKEVATYDEKPEMSAYEIKDKLIKALKEQEVDFVCLNFANADMVGHTGIFEAAVKACQTVDACAKAVTEVALEKGFNILVIADHGNSDCMRNTDGSPNTAHTTNLVPCILVSKDANKYSLKDGKLGDVAPTLLSLMGLSIPKEMTGKVLV